MHKWAQHAKEDLDWPDNTDDHKHNQSIKEIDKTKKSRKRKNRT